MHIKYNDTGNDNPLVTPGDPQSIRISRLKNLPDLSRTERSVVRLVVDRVLGVQSLAGCDIVDIPDILTVETNFDLLNIAADHPSRRIGDTYYVDDSHVLRTQTTSFWPYYLRDPQIVRRLEQGDIVKAVCYGKVYRRDEIDRHHYPVFHQIDGVCLCRKDRNPITPGDLSLVTTQIARAICGPDIVYREIVDAFPFTEPSMQLEVLWHDEWLELMGAGLVHGTVLQKLGLDPLVYNGWAFGFGLDRLAMVKKSIPDIRILWSKDPRVTDQFTDLETPYRDISRYPSTFRDISVLVDETLEVNRMYEMMRESGYAAEEDLIEEVRCIDRYASEKLGVGRVSYTFRIVYRSNIRTLTTEEVNSIQEMIRLAMAQEFNAVLR
jgi:phenylalanyl-tRNA synthetase alpha chain